MSINNENENPLGYKNEGKLLVGFAIPCIISMLVTALYNIVDQVFIGQGIGMLGNAATNIAFPLSTTCNNSYGYNGNIFISYNHHIPYANA